MSPARHFEIIVGGRQLAGLIALVAALLLVAFGLGVGVGLIEPRPEEAASAVPPVWDGRAETMPADRVFPPPTATPDAVALLTAEAEAPPAVPADVLAAESGTPPGPAAAGAAVPTPEPAATPAPRSTPTPRPRPAATPRPTVPPQYWIQVGALSQAEQAEGVRQRAIALGFAADQVRVLPGSGGKYRVRLGPFPDQESAGRVEARLKAQGFPDAYQLKE